MMRTIIPLVAFAIVVPAPAQEPVADSTGLPGDNFSLQGALELFKRNIEMERYEEELNTDSTHVNNLDLDGNGETDYVRVEIRREGDAVYVVMKVAVSATENQDVAVIGIEKTGEVSAILQIIGDEELYPANTIVEPFAADEQAVPSKGPRAPVLVVDQAAVNVWSWRPIPWCFSPRYYPYTSPWHWANYPMWWKPQPPQPFASWRGLGHPHRAGYRSWSACRVTKAQAAYAPHRSRSAAVHSRYQEAHQRYKKSVPTSGNTSPTQHAPPANGGEKKK